MEKNLFMIAAKEKYRFPSTKGMLTVEQLWDMPLTAKDGFCLDAVAKMVNAGLKEYEAESFVVPSDSKMQVHLQDQLEIVKAVIADKQETNRATIDRAEKRRRRNRLLEALENRESADLAGKTREELLKELEDLD